MIETTDRFILSAFKHSKIIVGVSFFSVITGLVILAGWHFNIPVLESLVPGFVTIKVNTAIGFILIGACLIITQLLPKPIHLSIYIVLATLLTILGLLTLSQYIFGVNFNIDEFFVADASAKMRHYAYPGRMATNTSICFVLFGAALLGLKLLKPFLHVACQYLLHMVTAVSAVAIMGYLYGVSSLYNFLYVSSMAFHTALLLFLLSIAGSLLNPHLGFTKLFVGNNISSSMARRHFASMLLMLVVFGFLGIQSERYHVFSKELDISILAIIFLLGTLFIVQNTALWLNKIDEKRSVAENEVKSLNLLLERKVEQRSFQLNTLIEQFRKSEEQYRSLIEQASDFIYVIDGNGGFLEVNDCLCKAVGYTADELLAMNIKDLLGEEQVKTQPLIYKQIAPGTSMIGERKYFKKGGGIVDVEVNVKKFTEERVMVIARDITRRREMEVELTQAELKFRILAERSVVGIYIVQNGKFVYVNPRFAAIFGQNANQLLGLNAVEAVVHSDYQEISRQHVRRLLSGEIESVQYEVMGKKKNDTANWVEFYENSVVFDGQISIIGSVIDITERKRAEDELRVSEHKYRLLFKSNPMPIWMIGKNNLSIIAANEAALRLYGYSQQEILKMTIIDLRPAEDRAQMMQLLYLNRHEPGDLGVVRHIKKDGSIIKVNLAIHDIFFEGQPIRLALTNDITEQLKIEEAHRKSEANLKHILRNTDTAYVLADRDLRILEYNHQAHLFTGKIIDFEPIVGRHIFDYVPESHKAQFATYVDKVLMGKTVSYEADRSKQGAVDSWYYIRMFPVALNDHELLGLMIAITDITERKVAERSLKIAYQRIEKHMNDIKDMMWKQSHLIRSPLANLKGLTSVLNDNPGDKEVLAYIESELNRLDHVIISMADESSKNDLAN